MSLIDSNKLLPMLWDYISDVDYEKVKKVISEIPLEEPVIRCKDCKHFEYDRMYVIQGIPVMGHLVCNKWGDGCRTKEDGFCFMAERRTDERFDKQTSHKRLTENGHWNFLVTARLLHGCLCQNHIRRTDIGLLPLPLRMPIYNEHRSQPDPLRTWIQGWLSVCCGVQTVSAAVLRQSS